MKYLVTNRLATSLIIEDIGVRLNASGGNKLLDEHTYSASRLIKEYEQKKWISVVTRSEPVAKPPIPIWPFSSSPVLPPAPPSPPADVVILHGLVAKLENIIHIMQSPARSAAPMHSSGLPIYSPAPQQQASDEPMFIPSIIVPGVVDMKINVATTETEKEDFDSGLAALKKARKKP